MKSLAASLAEIAASRTLAWRHPMRYAARMTYTVAALYQFVTIADPPALRERLRVACERHGIIGSLLVAPEGVNGTIAGSEAGIRAMLDVLRAELGEAAAQSPRQVTSNTPRCDGLSVKFAQSVTQPFKRMKVRLKREIVTLGVPEANPAVRVGAYVDPHDWNALISDPDTVVIDTRNDYEVVVGTFKNALDPKTESFGQFPAYVKANLDPEKHTKVAMFCTGGIRCEKASALMLQMGFKEVYHLQGGILKYLETIPPDESLWQGECFVFDERIAVTHGLAEGITRLCPVCDDAMLDGHTCTRCQRGTPNSDQYI